MGKARSDGRLYIATANGLFTTLDGGETWEALTAPYELFTQIRHPKLALHPREPEIIYLPLRGLGIIKSSDGGVTWQTTNQGLNNTALSSLVPHPVEADTLYAVQDRGSGLFKSSDYGDSWIRTGERNITDPAFRRIAGLTINPVNPNIVYQALNTGQILRSEDGGISWSAAWPGFRFSVISSLLAAPSDPSVLYAHRRGFGLFRSDDSGNTWAPLGDADADYAGALAVHPDTASFILIGAYREPVDKAATLHCSRDGGTTWDEVLALSEGEGITSVAIDPRVQPFFGRGNQPSDPTRLYAGSIGARGTLWFSNDGGDSWQTLNAALNFADVHSLVTAPGRVGTVYATLRDSGTWRTQDSGRTWERMPGDPAASAAAVAIDPSNQDVLYIADGTTPHLYRSTDNGHSWQLLFDAGPSYSQLTALAIAPSDARILYVSTRAAGESGRGGAVFRIDTNAPLGETAQESTGELPDSVSSFVVDRYDPLRILAIVKEAGLWRTTDGGLSWRPIRSGLPEISFAQIAVSPHLPDTLYLVGRQDLATGAPATPNLNPDESYGIWRSSDDGGNWTRVGGNTFGRASGPIRVVTFHPDDPDVLYAAGEQGVYLSPDQGETWTSINGRLPFDAMNAVATDGQTLYAGSAGASVFVGQIHPLIHTADWIPTSALVPPVHHMQLELHPQDPQVLYASAYPGGVFKTTDGGQRWSSTSFGLPRLAVTDPSQQAPYTLAIAPSAGETMYVGTFGRGVFRSDDAGRSWRPVAGQNGEQPNREVHDLVVHPTDPNTVYAATENGLWHTSDGGQTWVVDHKGLESARPMRSLALASDGQLYAGSGGYGVFVRSAVTPTLEGAWRQLTALGTWGSGWSSWQPHTPSQLIDLLVDSGSAETLYAGSFPSGFFRTSDRGQTWNASNAGLGNVGVLSLVSHPSDHRRLFAGTTDGVAHSADGGESWWPRDSGWPSGHWVLSLVIDPQRPDTLYACSQLGATRTSSETHGLVMKSTDAGASWSEITTGLDVNQAFFRIIIDRNNNDILYLATQRDGIYISRDAGATWFSWNEGLWDRTATIPQGVANEILTASSDGRLIYFGSAGSGVWRRPAEGSP
jgi:photosystem II stability/assembly factor-like uncharacterized protein